MKTAGKSGQSKGDKFSISRKHYEQTGLNGVPSTTGLHGMLFDVGISLDWDNLSKEEGNCWGLGRILGFVSCIPQALLEARPWWNSVHACLPAWVFPTQKSLAGTISTYFLEKFLLCLIYWVYQYVLIYPILIFSCILKSEQSKEFTCFLPNSSGFLLWQSLVTS